MLVNSESRFKDGDIITVKNILGEEIICTFVEEDLTHITIKDPWALGMSQQGMQLMPVVVSGAEIKDSVKFAKTHAMWVIPTDEQFHAGYRKHVTGLDIVEQSTKIIT